MKLIKQLSPIIFLLLISSCSMLDSYTSSRLCANDDGDFYQCKDLDIKKSNVSKPIASNNVKLSGSNVNFQLLSEYTEQMSMDIRDDVIGMNIDKVIAVASFVYFDEQLQSTNALGNQLAEYFLTDLQNIGLPVADHKVTALLNVTFSGDFSLSRNIEDLNPDIEIGYVFTGTMIPNAHGIVINARLINRESGHIIAATSKLLPNMVINNVL